MNVNSGSSIALDEKERISRYKFAYRNENYLYRKEGWKGVLYYIAKCGLNIARVLLYSKDYKLKRCYVILNCMTLGLFFNPKVESI